MDMKNKINISFDCLVTDEDIEDIMCAALEGGINYWCTDVEYSIKDLKKKVICGNDTKFYDIDGNVHNMTKDMLMSGIEKSVLWYLQRGIKLFGIKETRFGIGMYLDTYNIDAEVADVIIQFSLFDDIIFG